MCRLLVAFLLGLIPLLANAQTISIQGEIITLNKPLKCSDSQTVLSFFVTKFGEKPIWVGKDSETGSFISVLVNKDRNTWTVIQYDSKFACVLGAGEQGSSPDI